MNIAIIGSGFSGLSLAYFLLQSKPDALVSLFDFRGIGQGASGKASGLMHPYAGKRGRFSYKAQLALPCAVELLELADAASRKRWNLPVIMQKGIVRPAAFQKQEDDFRKNASETAPTALFCSAEKTQEWYPNPKNLPSLFIPDGLAIDSQQYIKTLYALCEEKGLIYRQERVASIEKIQPYFDAVIVAAGFESKALLPGFIQTSSVKGQRIDKALPADFAVPSVALSGPAYAAFSGTGCRTVCLGSTYEHNFADEAPDEAIATSEIYAKIGLFWPELTQLQTISIDAGIRATTQSSKPIVLHIEPNIWSITGLGSKGLLYHAWLSKLVSSAVIGDLSLPELADELSSEIFKKEIRA